MITTASLCTRRVAVGDDDTVCTHCFIYWCVLQIASINIVISSLSLYSPEHVDHNEDVAEGCTLSLVHLGPNQESGKQREPDGTAHRMIFC